MYPRVKGNPSSPQPEKARVQQQRPITTKELKNNKFLNFFKKKDILREVENKVCLFTIRQFHIAPQKRKIGSKGKNGQEGTKKQ